MCSYLVMSLFSFLSFYSLIFVPPQSSLLYSLPFHLLLSTLQYSMQEIFILGYEVPKFSFLTWYATKLVNFIIYYMDRYGCKSKLLQNLSGLGFKEPTPIQRQAIPVLLSVSSFTSLAPLCLIFESSVPKKKGIFYVYCRKLA